MKIISKIFFSISLFFFAGSVLAFSHGIYITEETMHDTPKLNYLIQESKKYGIDTFVVDLSSKPGKTYSAGIKNIVGQGIHYVARIVIFPRGGTHAQVLDKKIWEKRLTLAKAAAQLGASAIQLDYIRFRAENPPNPEKAKKILTVVNYFKSELAPYHVKLQIDIFGVAALKPAHTIGQDVGLLATAVNAFCPMVYPSHYEPYREHAVHPYDTVYHSVAALKKQLRNFPDVNVFAFIEIYNYRYNLKPDEKVRYILAEIKATHDAGANGWYVWSASNHYSPLFSILANRKQNVTQ